jgi:hypothetical protein
MHSHGLLEHFIFNLVLPCTAATHVIHQDADSATRVNAAAFFYRQHTKGGSNICTSLYTSTLHILKPWVQIFEHVKTAPAVQDMPFSFNFLTEFFPPLPQTLLQLLRVLSPPLMLTLQILDYVTGVLRCYALVFRVGRLLDPFIFTLLFLFFLDESGYFDRLFG